MLMQNHVRYEEQCMDNQYNETMEECNTWINDVNICGNPCRDATCPIFSKCNNTSTDVGGCLNIN